VVGGVSFHLKFALKVTHPLLKNADIDQYLLITSEEQELEKNVQLSRVESRLRAFQRAIDEARTSPLSPPKEWLKKANLSFCE